MHVLVTGASGFIGTAIVPEPIGAGHSVLGLDVPVASVPPEKAADQFGPMAAFIGADCPASSRPTRERLGWSPVRPGLVRDLEQGTYFDAPKS